MELLNILAAAAGSFAFGAVWYMVLANPWMAAARIEVDENGQPANAADKTPYLLGIISAILVAGMMRHIFSMSGVTGMAESIVGGLGIGLFFISPWIMLNNAFGDRPFKLTLIDGGYATIGCGIMGFILALF